MLGLHEVLELAQLFLQHRVQARRHSLGKLLVVDFAEQRQALVQAGEALRGPVQVGYQGGSGYGQVGQLEQLPDLPDLPDGQWGAGFVGSVFGEFLKRSVVGGLSENGNYSTLRKLA
ncbi:hypothetical protein [Hymenobacter sp.]|uniref:hypothetical protein n=1 Tax=Hymenobacter sp. TaxID=1898978 RepID=UPI002ED96E48